MKLDKDESPTMLPSDTLVPVELNSETAERKNADELRARLAAIVESSDDAIIGKDLNGIITSWNRGAERIFGYAACEVIGQPITILIPANRFNEEPGILERIRRGESVDHYETIRRRKDGTLLDISLTISPIIDAHGKVVGASKIARDISGRKDAEKERERLLAREQEARQEAEAANRVKDQFLAVVSHELRNPLGTILMWTNMWKSGTHLNELPRAMEVIERNARLQLRLVEDLLDLNRVSRGQITLDVATHDLCAILRPSLESTQLGAETKHVMVEFEGTNEPVLVKGDSVRLQQVFTNVLSK
jgi:two-component system, chemotaxis family, CheB/CheR fusion protein